MVRMSLGSIPYCQNALTHVRADAKIGEYSDVKLELVNLQPFQCKILTDFYLFTAATNGQLHFGHIELEGMTIFLLLRL